MKIREINLLTKEVRLLDEKDVQSTIVQLLVESKNPLRLYVGWDASFKYEQVKEMFKLTEGIHSTTHSWEDLQKYWPKYAALFTEGVKKVIVIEEKSDCVIERIYA